MKTTSVNGKVNNMAEEVDEILNYVREINERAGILEKTAVNNNEDATHVNDTMKDFVKLSKDLNDIIDSIAGSVNGITIAVEESADGVASVAVSVDSLVSDISGVNKEIEMNKEISNKFKEETDCFVNL